MANMDFFEIKPGLTAWGDWLASFVVLIVGLENLYSVLLYFRVEFLDIPIVAYSSEIFVVPMKGYVLDPPSEVHNLQRKKKRHRTRSIIRLLLS